MLGVLHEAVHLPQVRRGRAIGAGEECDRGCKGLVLQSLVHCALVDQASRSHSRQARRRAPSLWAYTVRTVPKRWRNSSAVARESGVPPVRPQEYSGPRERTRSNRFGSAR